MFEDRDLYQAFYTDYLWRLLPEVYRASDSDEPDKTGPLRELVARLGAQIAVVRRSIDRTVEDQSIESCDDWLIPYIGDLLATNIVAGLDSRAQRLDVAKTIYYRRRKGTVGLLEELSADITGWNARIVEFFRRLARHRHNFDPEIGLDRDQSVIEGLRGTLSGTPAGGFADLRHAGAAQKTTTAFDEYFHTADFRRGRDLSGWHNIPKLGVFLWRLRSYRYLMMTPVEDSACPNQFTFDPTGREIPLFARDFRDPSQYGDAWVSPDEWMLPGRISTELLKRETARLYPDSLAIFDVSAAGPTQLPFANFTINPERGRYRQIAPPSPGAARRVLYHHGFSSEIGAGPYDRRALSLEDLPEPAPIAAPVTGGGAQLQTAQTALGATGAIPIGDSLTYTAVANPWNVTNVLVQGGLNECPVVRWNGKPWVITGSANAKLALEGILYTGSDIILRGTFDTVTISCSTIDPGEEIDPVTGVIPQTVDARPLVPATIWIEGAVANLVLRRAICGPIRTRLNGAVERITATDSILQGVRSTVPGNLTADSVFDTKRFARRLRNGADPLATFLRTSLPAAAAAALALYNPANPPTATLLNTLITELNTILGAGALFTKPRFEGIPLPPSLDPPPSGLAGAELLAQNRLLLEAAMPIELQPAAIASATAEVSLERCTVLGSLHAHRISASESILHGFAVAEDPQSGCVRFSAYVAKSRLHQPYESVTLRENSAIFRTRRFGQPEYSQLARLADREILSGAPGASVLSGAQDGSEMGAFALERNPVKERGLRIKLGEYMPIGLTPVLIFVT